MRLLILTQKVDINDDILGFFHRWIEEFAKRCEKVIVICLQEGRHDLPSNVKVLSLGEEEKFLKIKRFFRLQSLLLKHIGEVDGVFCHMCPIYAIAAFPLAKMFRKKLILWYVHKSVNPIFKVSEKLVDKILTASQESCRLKSRKIKIVGHGIDTDVFKPKLNANLKPENEKFKILFVGRISPIKDLETLIRAIDVLVNQMKIKDIQLNVVGDPRLASDQDYLNQIKNLIQEKKLENFISFFGKVPHTKIIKFYQNIDIFVNLCPTGGMDKVVLEAMACGDPVLICNRTFGRDFGKYAEKLIFQEKNAQDLAQKIHSLENLKDRVEIRSFLRKQVVQKHNLDNLIGKIISEFKK